MRTKAQEDRFHKALARTYRTMKSYSQIMRRDGNSGQWAHNGVSIRWRGGESTPTVQVLTGWTQWAEGEAEIPDIDLQPAEMPMEKLVCLSRLTSESRFGHGAFMDGSDMLVVGDHFAYSTPMKIDLLHDIGKGERIFFDTSTMNIIAHIIEAAEHADTFPLRVSAGVPDGETFVLDLVLPELEGIGFHFRIEKPIVFDLWSNFTPPIMSLMGETHIVTSPVTESLTRALSRCEKMKSIRCELIFENGSMSVRPLTLQMESGAGDSFSDDAEPLTVRTNWLSGPAEARYQFPRVAHLRAAVAMFGCQEMAMSVGELIGSPLVFWEGETRLAVQTAERR